MGIFTKVFKKKEKKQETKSQKEKKVLKQKIDENKEYLLEIGGEEVAPYIIPLGEFSYDKYKQFFINFPGMHKAIISKNYPDIEYLDDLDDFIENFDVLRLNDKNNEELQSQQNIMFAKHKKTELIYLLMFIPTINIPSDIEFHKQVFIGVKIFNYLFYISQEIELDGRKIKSFKDMLQLMESKDIADMHIVPVDYYKYKITARIGGGKMSGVVPLIKNVPRADIDGVMHDAKILMNKDTVEDIPVDSGLIKIPLTKATGEMVDRSFRVSIMKATKYPSEVGDSNTAWSVSIRKAKTLNEIRALNFEGLGYLSSEMDIFNSIMNMEGGAGLHIVGGPTNSGKSTLLTLLLDKMATGNLLNRGKKANEKRILAIDNPIEIETDSWVQVDLTATEYASDKLRMTKDKAMKEFLRQDPDATLLSEIRDAEEIQKFVEMGSQGSTTFATMHIETITDAFVRMFNALQGKGDPLDAITSLKSIVIQGLVPKVCQHCGGTGLMRGSEDIECPQCGGSGNKGIVPICEMLFIKHINILEVTDEGGNLNRRKLFDFKALYEKGYINYVSRVDVAEELFSKNLITEDTLQDIKLRYRRLFEK